LLQYKISVYRHMLLPYYRPCHQSMQSRLWVENAVR